MAIVALIFIALISNQSYTKDHIRIDGPGIASAHPLATQVGFKILEQGGNAFDAAVAVSAALSVVEPYSSGIGGGGFFLLYRSSDNFTTFVDAREVAPGMSDPDMYLDSDRMPSMVSISVISNLQSLLLISFSIHYPLCNQT